MSSRSKTPGSSVCEQCGFESLLSRRAQNVSGRWCVKCGARFCGEASRIDDGTDAGGTTTTNGSRRDSANSGGNVISGIGGGLSANKRKRSQESESYSNCSIMRKSDGNDNLGLSESPEPEPEPCYILCTHCNSYFYGHELYEKHFPCPRAPFLLEIQEDERRLESLRVQILNCEDIFKRLSKFVDGRKNLSSQPVAVVENVESVNDKSKSHSEDEATSKSRTIPKVTFGKKANVMPSAYKLSNSYYNRIQKSNQIRAKARTGKCFVYLESNLVDKQQTGQVKQILALEREVREMLGRVELLIIKSNSVFRNSTQIRRNSIVSIASHVVNDEPQEEGQIEIVNQNKVLEEQQNLLGSEPTEPVLDPLLDQEYSWRVPDDRTNLITPESNHFIINEFASQIQVNFRYGGNEFQNENYYHNDWICRQCFELMTELIHRQLDNETINPIGTDFYGALLSMDANCSLPPYCCVFYLNAIFLEEIESVMNPIMVEVNQEN